MTSEGVKDDFKQRREAQEAARIEQIQRTVATQARITAEVQAESAAKHQDAQDFKAATAFIGAGFFFMAVGTAGFGIAFAAHMIFGQDLSNWLLPMVAGLGFMLISVFIGLSAVTRSAEPAIVWNWTILCVSFVLAAATVFMAVNEAISVGIFD